MTDLPARRRFSQAVLLAAGLLLAACSSAGSIASSQGSPAVPSASVILSDPTTEAASSSSPMPEPVSPEASVPQPPAASIAVEGGDAVVGELGSFTWQNSGSDSPWLDGNPIRIGTGESLTLTLSEPVGIESWTAALVPPSDLGTATSVGLGEGSGEPVTFAAPPAGTWSVNVNVWFVDNIGSASYYWLVEVD